MKRVNLILTTVLITLLATSLVLSTNTTNIANNSAATKRTLNVITKVVQLPNTTNQGIGQTIKNKIKAGTYITETGKQIRVKELAKNRIQLTANNINVNCNNCNLTQETTNARTKLKLKLKNGRNAEIKIMPETASARAIERLKLKFCNPENNCTIELKEVGQGENTRPAYEARVKKAFRLFGLFRIRKEITTQIDAETGEEIKTKRPWWSFLATEKEE